MKLWELNPSVHCSVIGTCLTTGELRKAMVKALRRDVSGLSDHDLHSQAVGLCDQRDEGAKILHKALDRRHQGVISRFAKLPDEDAVMAQWANARRTGDIPSACWAVLTHPETGLAGMRRAFGDVHMLSHLVGAANRADIRRLAALEEENAALAAKVERQQQRLHETTATRDAAIRQLGALVAQRAASEARSEVHADDALAGLRHLVADLQTRLGKEGGRRERLERRLRDVAVASEAWRRRAAEAEATIGALHRELALLEQVDDARASRRQLRLSAQRVLYVGGRPGCVEQASALLAAAGGELLCHDGGRHDQPSLLPGLIGRADHVVFPVDCVSHDAALSVKRVCRQLGKPWSPLRTGGVGSFLAALAGTDHAAPSELTETSA
ncbi:MAG: DUF2325 domain-containing protein [Acetobacteraceae bacterium]|nr:DUF2325 domain-containing protein [Acetobacteraceae bacterium]